LTACNPAQNSVHAIDELSDAELEYVTTHVAGDYAYLEWQAKANGAGVCHGADSFVVRDGLIRAQTIDYRVHER
jgi:hypothetical protein